ncbi:hypothetical protein EVAR_70272_1 [Eumeta japonica]|uniref:Uncharacterized protein n=1 Tax=Eumeta variegata TaxID=151549 RepID=A0A4C2A6U9_EUMVA|nr:hypothetical protein EVAR_70272_1 [Eumeta japonica]
MEQCLWDISRKTIPQGRNLAAPRAPSYAKSSRQLKYCIASERIPVPNCVETSLSLRFKPPLSGGDRV